MAGNDRQRFYWSKGWIVVFIEGMWFIWTRWKRSVRRNVVLMPFCDTNYDEFKLVREKSIFLNLYYVTNMTKGFTDL